MIVAQFSFLLSQSWDSIDRSLTVRRIKAYLKYWRQHPPTHLLVASYMQYNPPQEAAESAQPGGGMDKAIEKLAQLFGVPLPPERPQNGE